MIAVTMSSGGLETVGRSSSISSPETVFLTPTSKQPPLNISGTPVLEDCPQNDDERERRQRRRSRVVDLQLSNTDSPHSVASPSRKPDTPSILVPKFTNTQIADHYSTCIKLSTENKITTKNAFGLHLIDFMTEILQEKDSEVTNFKVAAGTLDASTKIYAVRVDAVHADVYRVLGGLGKSAPSAEGADSQEADGGPAAPGTIKKVQKPKKKHQGKTIEQNLNNINVSEADRKYEIDPMFQKTAASFDECSTAGVFLSSLHCSDYRSELLFHSDVRPLSTAEPLEFPALGSVEVADLKSALLQCVEERQICPSLAEFQFSKWDNDALTESLSVLVDKFKKSDQVFDINSEIEDSDNEECAGVPVEDDFDADIHDQTAGGDREFRSCQKSSEFQNSRQEVISLGDGDIGTMCLHLSMKPGEYSYFSPRTMSMWAGPDHWRFKPHRKQDPNSQQEKKKKTTKKVFEINFEEEMDFNAHFRKTRAATTLAKSTLDNQSKKATTLPSDFHYEIENIVQLNLKPGNKLRKMASQSASSEQDDEIEEYDYNNPNDTSEFCPAVPDNENDADENGLDNPIYGELKLVAEPQKVNKIEIHYAKTAKKMDMKRLKQSMWNLLTDGQEKEAVAENETEPKGNLNMVPDEKIFSDLTKDLLKNLPPLMAQNLSVPLAFACLLHLANEKNLTLKVVEDLSDVLVVQGN
ncbi:condensin complex subunit 2 isoform X2 [Trichosurus vulpecula]|uniref:condensin complex subunit 2 isoform X2 n=1 Tax=Trichosurus vulpecula TaxID=9337 RepID=UPI00186ACB75|nr:condensin complex subunit 2 isoform X2 [Trichosurus vulpecula]